MTHTHAPFAIVLAVIDSQLCPENRVVPETGAPVGLHRVWAGLFGVGCSEDKDGLPLSRLVSLSWGYNSTRESVGVAREVWVEGLPWVPDRPTLGSRFFSGLCQVPVNKMVSGGFPRVFRFPQLLL